MNYTIENEELTLNVSSHGAEIRSLKDKKTGREYMWWQGVPHSVPHCGCGKGQYLPF